MNLRFTVYGEPIPQGSQKAVTPKGGAFTRLVSDNKKLKPWRQEVALTVLALPDRPSVPWDSATGMVLDFYFVRPKSAKKRKYMSVKPDVDKLCRAIFDAIKGIVFSEDSRVCDARIRKFYAEPGTMERVEVLVGELL